MADGSHSAPRRCRSCGDEYPHVDGYCFECRDAGRVVHVLPNPAPLDPFDVLRGELRGADRYVEQGQESMARQKRSGAASLQSFLAAGNPIALTAEGQREALALGLVHYKTSGHEPAKTGRVAIEIDPLQARAQRLRKSVITSARLHEQETQKGSRRGAWYMLTLTYRDGSHARPRDVSDLFRCMRRYFNRLITRARRFAGEVFRYLWVGELTLRGRPHYHVLIWVPKGVWFGKPDDKGWWPHGSTKMERARNAVGYLAKYASKFTSLIAGQFPKGFRTHGCGGLNEESKRELRWWKASVEAREVLGPYADIRKAKGGWFDKLTGEFWPSPWRVTLLGGRPIAWKVVQL